MDPVEHWEGLYRTLRPAEASWFEPRPEVSLRLIEAASLPLDQGVLDIGAGTATLVDSLLELGYQRVGLLDISATALEATRARLGRQAARVEFFVGDVREFKCPRRWSLWHDRAVFHFLTEMEDQLAYRRALLDALDEKGHVVMATFGPEGPRKCSGLDCCRYDADSLGEWLGDGFELLQSELVDHETPGGAIQQFIYCRFHRN